MRKKTKKRPKKLSTQKKILFSLIGIFLGLIVTEGILQLVDFTKDHFFKKADRRLNLSAFSDSNWGEEYFKELNQIRAPYHSYIGWRRNDFNGKHITIKNGVRKTWNPSFSEEKPKTLFVFGGSTVWGTGARDDYTIPSHLSKQINETNANWQVINYGEKGYSLTQEIVYFTLLLKKGIIPDLVIFYDGVNDIYATYQNGKPGEAQNVYQIRQMMDQYYKSNFEKFTEGLSGLITEDSIIGESIAKPIKKLFRKKKIEGVVASDFSDEDLMELAKVFQSDYFKNMIFVEKLAKAYGFQYHFFLQPVVYSHPNPTEEEKDFKGWRDTGRVKLFNNVYSLFKNSEWPHFTNLSDILDSKEKTLYIDFCHLTEEGNALLAEGIRAHLKEKLI